MTCTHKLDLPDNDAVFMKKTCIINDLCLPYNFDSPDTMPLHYEKASVSVVTNIHLDAMRSHNDQTLVSGTSYIHLDAMWSHNDQTLASGISYIHLDAMRSHSEQNSEQQEQLTFTIRPQITWHDMITLWTNPSNDLHISYILTHLTWYSHVLTRHDANHMRIF